MRNNKSASFTNPLADNSRIIASFLSEEVSFFVLNLGVGTLANVWLSWKLLSKANSNDKRELYLERQLLRCKCSPLSFNFRMTCDRKIYTWVKESETYLWMLSFSAHAENFLHLQTSSSMLSSISLCTSPTACEAQIKNQHQFFCKNAVRLSTVKACVALPESCRTMHSCHSTNTLVPTSTHSALDFEYDIRPWRPDAQRLLFVHTNSYSH